MSATAPRASRPSLVRTVLLLAVATTAGTAAYLALRRPDSLRPGSDSAGSHAEDGRRPGLVLGPGSPRSPRSRQADDSDGARPTSREPPSTTSTTSPRMMLAVPGSPPADLEIRDIYHTGHAWSGDRLRELEGRIEARAGRRLYVSTDDPRAVFPRVWLLVPDPVPAFLTVSVPARNDSKRHGVVLEVLDAVTGAPLPDATLESGGGEAPRIASADAQGRIVFEAPGDAPDSDALAVGRFLAHHGYVSAPGHFGAGENALPTGPPAWDTWDEPASPEAAAISAWAERGTWPVRLAPTPPTYEDRRVRVVDAADRPVRDVVLSVNYPRNMGEERTWRWGDGVRRTDAEGVARFPMPAIVGLDAYVSGSLVAAWVLARAAWPTEGPRTLRLPEWSDVEFEVQELPQSGRIRWYLDGTWGMRDAGQLLIRPSLDPRALLRSLEAQELSLAYLDVSGEIGAKASTFRFLVPVGTTKKVQFTFDPEDAEDRLKRESRMLNVQAPRPGVLRISRRWTELERED